MRFPSMNLAYDLLLSERKAKQLPDFGFIFDETPVQTEVAATLNIVKEYNNVLNVGAVDPEKTLPEFLNKLLEAVSETIVA